MSGRLRSRLTYANVMATIAVFVALGGSSYAAIAITGRDVEDGSLTGRDVRDGSLSAAELAPQAVTAARRGRRGRRGPRGSRGRRGRPGPAGPTGPPGPRGVAGATNVARRETPQPNCSGCTPSDTLRLGSARCLPGERVTGGGYELPPGSIAHLSRPAPPSLGNPGEEQWEVRMDLPDGYTDDGWSIYVLCASP